MKISSPLIAAAMLSAGASVVTLAQARAAGSWFTAAPLPEPRVELSVIELNGKIYAIGGAIGTADGRGVLNGGATPLVEEYDPAVDRWRMRAPLPRALTHVGVATVNGKIYSFGGFLGDIHREAQTDAFVYDPASDQWTALPPLPSPRGSVGAVTVNGKIHVVGGRDPKDQMQTTHGIFDPATRTWTSAAPLPVGRDHLSALVVDGKIHVIGGRTKSNYDLTAYHDVYDPASDKWTAAAPMPTPRSAMAATLYKNMIVVFGGECRDRQTFIENEGYDLATGTWRTLAPSEGRHGFGAATVGNRAYFVAGGHGCGSGEASNQLRVFTLP